MDTERLVGAPRFELGTPCTPCKCATRLRHAPTEFVLIRLSIHAAAKRSHAGMIRCFFAPGGRPGLLPETVTRPAGAPRLRAVIHRVLRRMRVRRGLSPPRPSAPQHLHQLLELDPHLPDDLLTLRDVG